MLEVENIYDSVGTTSLETAVLYCQRCRTATSSWRIQRLKGYVNLGHILLSIQLFITILPRQEYYTVISCIMAEHVPRFFKTWHLIKFQSDYSYDPYVRHRNVGIIHICLISFFIGFVLDVNSSGTNLILFIYLEVCKPSHSVHKMEINKAKDFFFLSQIPELDLAIFYPANVWTVNWNGGRTVQWIIWINYFNTKG